jgi:hypothetical protein
MLIFVSGVIFIFVQTEMILNHIYLHCIFLRKALWQDCYLMLFTFNME